MPEKIKIILIASFSVLIVYGVFFVAWPKWQDISKARSNFDMKIEELKLRAEIIDKVNDFLANFSKIENEAKKVLLSIPSGAEIPEIILQIDEISRQNGIVIKNLGFSKSEKKAGGLSIFNISANTAGSYQALKNFVYAVEQNVRLMDMTNLSFNLDSSNANIFNINISLSSYFK